MKVADISGFGGREHGGYEWGCQVIAARATRFLEQQKTESELPNHKMLKNVTGLAIADNDAARKMDEYILDHPDLKKFGVTGAMHQYGIMHGTMRHRLGMEEYERQLREGEDGRKDEDFFEFNEADAFPEAGFEWKNQISVGLSSAKNVNPPQRIQAKGEKG